MITHSTTPRRPALTDERRRAIREARRKLYANSSFWVEEFRARLVALITSNVNTVNQKELAEKLGVTPANVSSFLNSTSDFKASTYFKMLGGLGYSPVLQFIKTSDMADAEYDGAEFRHGQVLSCQQALSIFGHTAVPYYEIEMRQGTVRSTYRGDVDEDSHVVQQLRNKGVYAVTLCVGQGKPMLTHHDFRNNQ